MREFRGHDVAGQVFSLRRKGFDPVEVGAFLAEVGCWVDALLRRVAESERSERAAVLVLQKAQETADRAVLAAAVHADQVRSRAEAEAQDLLAEARARADQIIRTSRAQADQALLAAAAEVSDLRRSAESARRNLAMAEAATVRFGQERAALLRRQADELLTAAEEIMSCRPDAIDALVVSGGAPEAVAPEPEADEVAPEPMFAPAPAASASEVDVDLRTPRFAPA
jgi:cell division septum initiation protein DivIVA